MTALGAPHHAGLAAADDAPGRRRIATPDRARSWATHTIGRGALLGRERPRGDDPAAAGRAKRAILLDALGTLVRFEDPAPLLRSALSERHGVEVGLEDARAAVRAEIAAYRRLHGQAGDAAALAVLRRTCATVVRDTLGAPAAALGADELVPTLVDCFRFAPFPEVHGVLDTLRARGHALAVVSNWDVSLHDVLERVGLAARLDAVVISAELGIAKPDPAPFWRALELLGASAAGALHAGDQLDEDVAGARTAGVRPVLVARDGASPPPGVAVVRTLEGLLDLAP